MLAPIIEKYLRKQSLTDEAIEQCPGEKNCTMFSVAIAETGNGLDACSICDLLPTKNKKPETSELFLYLRLIERLRSEQRAGEKIDWSLKMPIEWEGFVEWHRVEAEVDADFKAETNQIYQVLLARQIT